MKARSSLAGDAGNVAAVSDVRATFLEAVVQPRCCGAGASRSLRTCILKLGCLPAWELVESDTPRLESGTWVSYLGSGTVFRWNQDLAGSRFTTGKARWFQEMPGCSRKARVVSGKAVCCMKDWAVFQERFGGVRKVWGGSRKGCVVSGKAV